MGKQMHVFEVSDFEASGCVTPADVICGVIKAGRCLPGNWRPEVGFAKSSDQVITELFHSSLHRL